MGILDEAESLSESYPYIKAVIHGETGAGKTEFAASAPNPTWIDFERSSDTLRAKPQFAGIKVFRPPTWRKAFEYARAAVGVYETLVFDTVTSMQIKYMDEYMVKMEADSHKSGYRGQPRERFVRYQQDFNYATNELTAFFLFLQEAPINVIFCAHSDFIKNEEGSTIRIQPSLTPRVWGNLRAFISVVGYLEKTTTGVGQNQRTVRKLYLNSTNVIQAKNRFGIQETFVEKSNFKEMFKL